MAKEILWNLSALKGLYWLGRVFVYIYSKSYCFVSYAFVMYAIQYMLKFQSKSMDLVINSVCRLIIFWWYTPSILVFWEVTCIFVESVFTKLLFVLLYAYLYR